MSLERARKMDSSLSGYSCYPALSDLMLKSRSELSCFENLVIKNDEGTIVFESVDLIGTGRRQDMPKRILSLISITPGCCSIGEDLLFSSAVCSLKYCFNWALSAKAFFSSLLLKKNTFFLSRDEWTGEWEFYIRESGDYTSEFCAEAYLGDTIASTDKEDLWIIKALGFIVCFLAF